MVVDGKVFYKTGKEACKSIVETKEWLKRHNRDKRPILGTIAYTDAPTDTYNAFTTTLLPTMTEVDSLEVSSGVLDLDTRSYLTMDGTDDNINMGSAADLDDFSGTYAFWIKRAGIGTRENLMYKGTNLQFEIQADNTVNYFHRAGTDEQIVTSTTIADTNWHHIVLTCPHSSVDPKMFIDGVEVSYATQQDAASSTITTDASSDLHFGAIAGTTDFTGNYRDIRMYDYLLSDEQILSLYLGRYNVTPLHWWKFDGDANDSGTGTTSNGTLAGNAALTTANFKVNGSARIGTHGSI